MLRLPQFGIERPETIEGALSMLATSGAVIVAGGTDLVPNMKHRIVEPSLVVSLDAIKEMRGITIADDGALVIGAMTRLDEIAHSAEVIARAPVLAAAAGIVASPQIRRMGTLGGNVMLDTRCRYINQTYFWRKSLGWCLKKDGTLCHVVAGGRKCVAAASNDSAPALMTLGAELVVRNASGERRVKIDDIWHSDGIYNKKVPQGDLVTHIRVPRQRDGHRGAYGKMRERGSFDFPQLGIAVRLDCSGDEVVDADVVIVALQARPLRMKGIADVLRGAKIGDSFEQAARAAGENAFAQCHPMPNIPGDPDYRREMVPIYVRRTLMAAAGLGEAPRT